VDVEARAVSDDHILDVQTSGKRGECSFSVAEEAYFRARTQSRPTIYQLVGAGTGLLGPYLYDYLIDRDWAAIVTAGGGTEGQSFTTFHGHSFKVYSTVQAAITNGIATIAAGFSVFIVGNSSPYAEGLNIPSFGGTIHIYGSGWGRVTIGTAGTSPHVIGETTVIMRDLALNGAGGSLRQKSGTLAMVVHAHNVYFMKVVAGDHAGSTFDQNCLYAQGFVFQATDTPASVRIRGGHIISGGIDFSATASNQAWDVDGLLIPTSGSIKFCNSTFHKMNLRFLSVLGTDSILFTGGDSAEIELAANFPGPVNAGQVIRVAAGITARTVQLRGTFDYSTGISDAATRFIEVEGIADTWHIDVAFDKNGVGNHLEDDGGISVSGVFEDSKFTLVPTDAQINTTAGSSGNIVDSGVITGGSVGVVPGIAHKLLSATHDDTLAGTVVRGDLVVGNATPAWARLARPTIQSLLYMRSSDPAWADAVAGDGELTFNLGLLRTERNGEATFEERAFSATPTVAGFALLGHARGTKAAPTNLLSGDVLGAVIFEGYGGSFLTSAYVRAVATENFSGAAIGTKLEFYVTPNGTTTLTLAATLEATGDLTLAQNIVMAAGKTVDGVDVSDHVVAADPHTGYRLESADHTHQSTGIQAGQLDHGLALTGLTDDDHTNYALLAGRASGQEIKGDTAASGILTLTGTAHATKGHVAIEGTKFSTEASLYSAGVELIQRWTAAASGSYIAFDTTLAQFRMRIAGQDGIIASTTALNIKVVPLTVDMTITLSAIDQTFTVTPNLILVQNTLTLDFVNTTIRGYQFQPTIIYNQAGNTNGSMSLFNARPTLQNKAATAISTGPLHAFASGLIIKADGAAFTPNEVREFLSGPAFSVINAGTLTITNWTTFYARDNSAVGLGVTVTNKRAIWIDNATVAGTLTNQIGIDIAALTSAVTLNIGIRNAASLVQSGNVGFFTVTTPIAQQTSGGNLTNNVTAGGTTDQIDNFTSLTIYATDAAAIRNDIYQLARKLKQVNDALRAYGLLT